MVYYGAAIVAFVLIVFSLRKIWVLLARFIWYYGCIWTERNLLSKFTRVKFPRGENEIWEDPQRFFDFLTNNRVINSKGNKASLVKLEPLCGIETEPDKKATTASVRVIYNDDVGEEHKTDLFLKFQTGAHFPLWLQALRQAAEPDVVREIDFYTKLRDIVPVATPRVLYAGKLPAYNLVCLILENIDLNNKNNAMTCSSDGSSGGEIMRVVPDHEFSNVDDMKLLLTSVAKMHAMFYGKVNTHLATNWIPAKQGLDYCEFVLTLGGNKPKSYITLFKALQGYFKPRRLTLVHGDCRPGNMIFVNNPATKILFLDWEATNAAVPTWDFTYSTIIGLDPETRKKYHDSLLAYYHQSFISSLKDPPGEDETIQTFQNDAMLLAIVLFYIAYTVTTGEYWKNQGNTRKDILAWGNRVIMAFDQVSVKESAKLLHLEESVIQDVKLLARSWSILTLDR